MPVGIGEVDAAKPLAAFGAAALGGRIAGVLTLRNSLACAFFRFFRRLFHSDLGSKKRRSGREAA